MRQLSFFHLTAAAILLGYGTAYSMVSPRPLFPADPLRIPKPGEALSLSRGGRENPPVVIGKKSRADFIMRIETEYRFQRAMNASA